MQTRATDRNKGNATDQRVETTAYTASWVDELNAFLDHLPGRSWLYHLGIGLILFSTQLIVLWLEGVESIGILLPIHAFMAGVVSFFLALFRFLDGRAGTALESMRPVLKTTEAEFEELHYQLTTLPRRPTLSAGVIMISLAMLSEAIGGAFTVEDLAGYPISATLFRVHYYALWWLLGTYLYHTLHQLRLIDHVYTHHTHINLFRAKPFYAFSILSALTAGSLGVIVYGWLLVNPTMHLDDPFVLVWVIFILVSAVVTFLWPQLGMYRLQVVEQDRLLDEAYSRLESVVAELHRQLDDGEYGRMEDLSYAIASLETEVNTIKGIRTWPWEPETLQILVTALALPLGLWLIQMLLERLLAS